MRLFLSLAALAVTCTAALAQDAPPAPKASREWSYYLSVFGYIVPEDRSYVSPVLTADRGVLHLEARYNYENLETGSLWIGRTFTFGKKVSIELTPMIGVVFGRTNGVAPGYNASLTWRRLTIEGQGEYLFNSKHDESFFYSWSELSYTPVNWFRIGLAAQRTKAYQTPLEVQRGVLAGVYYKRLDFTTYVFNLGWAEPTTVLAIGYQF